MSDVSIETQPEDPAQAWEQPSRSPPDGAAPVLSVDGFEGPLDWLLEMARGQRIDLTRLSILALVGAFTVALDAALAEGRARRVDLARWGDWLVMAATLALLRSRLMLPKDAPDARAAQEEAEALRRHLLEREALRRAAAWLDGRVQLGRDAFGKGASAAEPAATAREADIADLLQACLVALRVPEHADTYAPSIADVWRVPDAMARITRLLADRPEGGDLPVFLPEVRREGPEFELRCRAALASTIVAGLELARGQAVSLAQSAPWDTIHVTAAAREAG